MFYAVHAYSVADEGPDFARDLARADRLRAERLILVALKIPQPTGVLRRAFLDARDDLLNEDALEDAAWLALRNESRAASDRIQRREVPFETREGALSPPI
jgi:hypothetical protein